MSITSNPTTRPLFTALNPWLLLIVTLVVTMVGFQFIGSFIGVALAYLFYPGDQNSFLEALFNPMGDYQMRTPLLIMQGVASFIGFIIMPWLLLKFYYKGKLHALSIGKPKPLLILIAVLITLFFMGVNARFIEWNENFSFPEALSALEEKLKALEDLFAKTTAFITNFDSLGQFFLGVIVVAIIPGIGEEFVFRGLIQNHIYRISKNIHVAIWMGALLFSIFHVQFYGLIPRMFLGAMFGYLYYFSGNIIYPMVAHFFNNGFTLVMLYLFQQDIVDFNIEETETLPWSQVIFSAVVTLALFISFRRNVKLKSANEQLD
jgi:CAAX protease family protein